MNKDISKVERLWRANTLIECIASCGRQFFRHGDRVSILTLDGRGRVWLVDKYTERRIYTHYRYEWRGFSDGGTLRALVMHLRDYITKGTPLPPSQLGPWPEWICDGDLWGYGDDMQQVRDRAAELLMLPCEQEKAA